MAGLFLLSTLVLVLKTSTDAMLKMQTPLNPPLKAFVSSGDASRPLIAKRRSLPDISPAMCPFYLQVRIRCYLSSFPNGHSISKRPLNSPRRIYRIHDSQRIDRTFDFYPGCDMFCATLIGYCSCCVGLHAWKKISPANFGFWAQNFFRGINQKSTSISMCKIYIYIDSECFRQIHWKM